MEAEIEQIESAVARRFDALRARFDETIGTDLWLADALVGHLEGFEGGWLLDVGCGKGRFFELWKRAGVKSVGLDRSRGMLRAGLFSAAFDGAKSLVQASARRLPFATESFDVVCAVESMAHFADFEGSLAEMQRVLRSGGKLILVDKNAGSLDPVRPYLPGTLVKRVDEWRGLWMYPRGFAFRERWFRRRELLEMLDGSFDALRCEYVLSPEEVRGNWAWLFRRCSVLRRRMLVSGIKRASPSSLSSS